MAWITPVLNWNSTNSINYADWNRIENNILELNNYLASIQYATPTMTENVSAVSFDGVDDYVNVTTSSFPVGASTRTIEFWMNPDGIQQKSVMAYGTAVSGQLFEVLLMNSGAIGIHWYGNGVTSEFPNTIYAVGVFQHISITYDGSSIRTYINGVLKDTYANALNTVDSGVFKIGSGIYGGAFRGFVDEVRVWNVARTQSEIQSNMYKNLIGTETGLVGYWVGNDGSGTTLTATKGNNGTLINGTSWTSSTQVNNSVNKRRNSYLGIEYLSSINRIENNLDAIRLAFISPSDYLPKETWTVGKGFDYTDANRLEQNTNSLLNWGMLVYQSYRYCGTFSCGESGGLE